MQIAVQKVRLNQFLTALPLLVAPLLTLEAYGMDLPKNQIRTYMQYTLPIDPARIITISDMDISYALATTLVTWSPLKQIREGVAKAWSFPEPKTIRFKLREDLKWSDGTPLRSEDIKRSFDRALKLYPGSLRSLADILDHFGTPTPTEIDFVLKVDVASSGLLRKLTEPDYGVLFIEKDGTTPNFVRSSGAFSLEHADDKELKLKRNPHYVFTSAGVADSVLIRKLESGTSPAKLILNDPWPNLVEASSMLDPESERKLKDRNFTLWSRPMDKVGLLSLSSKKLTPDKVALLRYLHSALSRDLLLQGITGQMPANQLFPNGYSLFDPYLKPSPPDKKAPLPEVYKSRPVKILISPDRFDQTLEDNLSRAIKAAVGKKPSFQRVPINEISKWLDDGDFDFYAGTMGLADPDPDGIMSYYFEGEYSVVPPFNGKYIRKLDLARKEKDELKRLSLMRAILNESIEDGGMLPLFHFSTLGIGKDGVDFSSIPSTDESVTFSKVRFKVTK